MPPLAAVLDPVAVGLKFGFLAVLYLFLLWMARSTLKDLRRGAGQGREPAYDDATGMHVASQGIGRHDLAAPRLRVESAAGLRAGAAYDLSDGALLGRGEQADIQLEDGFASTSHARLVPHGDVIVLEDLGSTNGTYLNGEPLSGPQPLHMGDKIRIGDSEFTFER
jgi:FHA domain-containing protein